MKRPSSGRLRDGARGGLAGVGRFVPSRTAWALNAVANYLDAGRRLHSLGLAPRPSQRSRFGVFDAAIAELRTARRPLYLEFGVWEGATIGYWASNLANPDARFIGFDSFEGLPDAWDDRFTRGTFDVGGQMPQSDDGRVRFVKGWFDATLPGFEPPPHDRLVVTVDSDLYSSAMTVLDWATPHLQVGDLLYFDEFNDRLHEARAFEEFVTSTGWRFEVVANTYGLVNVLFRRLA